MVPATSLSSRARVAHTRVHPLPNANPSRPTALPTLQAAVSSSSRRSSYSRHPESSRSAWLLPPPLRWSQRPVATAAAEELLRAVIRSRRPKEPENRRTDPRGAARTPTGCLPALASPRSIRALLLYEIECFWSPKCSCVWVWGRVACVQPSGSSSLTLSPRRRRTRARKGQLPSEDQRAAFRRKSPPSYSFPDARVFRVCVHSCSRRRFKEPLS